MTLHNYIVVRWIAGAITQWYSHPRWVILPLIYFLLLVGAACGGSTFGGAATATTRAVTAPPPPADRLLPTATSGVTPGPEPTPTAKVQILEPVVTVGDAVFAVELALTPDQRAQGLSGRPTLAPGTGMLFVYNKDSRYSFWMKDMRFPLGLVWIGAGCTVVDITHNAPPPAPGQVTTDLPLYIPAVAAQYVLEINAGEVESAGIQFGAPVTYTGSLSGLYGC